MSPFVIPQSWKGLLCVSIFAVAMGFFEAICVIYIRDIIIPAGFDISYPIAPMEHLPFELMREACTLIMLLAVAWMLGFNWLTRLVHFFFMFGIWDITYYIGLKLLVHWPSSWLQWDCLFLIPKPWYGPVLAPVLISVYIVLTCTLLLTYKNSKTKLRLSASAIALHLLAFSVWYWSFVKDSDHITALGYEGVTYSWILFICGMISSMLGLWLMTRPKRTL